MAVDGIFALWMMSAGSRPAKASQRSILTRQMAVRTVRTRQIGQNDRADMA
jgi:hypothetical protein